MHALFAIITGAVFYLTLRSDAVTEFNGVDIGSEAGWQRLANAVTTATPIAGFEMATRLPRGHERLVVYFEVNHSADFNEFFPAAAAETKANYSGDEWGSGQPALVYLAEVRMPDMNAEVPLGR